jgi:hypothetical protein
VVPDGSYRKIPDFNGATALTSNPDVQLEGVTGIVFSSLSPDNEQHKSLRRVLGHKQRGV